MKQFTRKFLLHSITLPQQAIHRQQREKQLQENCIAEGQVQVATKMCILCQLCR